MPANSPPSRHMRLSSQLPPCSATTRATDSTSPVRSGLMMVMTRGICISGVKPGLIHPHRLAHSHAHFCFEDEDDDENEDDLFYAWLVILRQSTPCLPA